MQGGGHVSSSLESNLKYLDALEQQDCILFTLLFLNKLEQIVGFINIVFLHSFGVFLMAKTILSRARIIISKYHIFM